MSQIVLYRKYRSNDFDEIVGQEHVVATLKSAVKSGEVGHAYLFAGPRGIGKTSFARILSRAVNCQDLKDGYNPCNNCVNCMAFLSGSSLDMVEIDAASHRGIDDIRFLQEGASFAPVSAKRKVFIIDEVHMLTKEAFNALLKTLEEPPEHAMFILATTEIDKVPETIISRCQTFWLRRLTENEIAGQLQKVALAEGRELDYEVAKVIASSVKGGMRDALGVLEQVLVLNEKEITKESVYGVLGLVEGEVLDKITSLILAKEVGQALGYYLDHIYFQGVDVFRLMKSLEWYWRDKLLAIYKDKPENIQIQEKDLLVMLDELQLIRTKHYEIDSLFFEIFLIKVAEKINGNNISNAKFEPKISEEVKTKEVISKVDNNNEKKEIKLTLEKIKENWDLVLKDDRGQMPLVVSILKMSKVLGVDGNKIKLGVSFALQKSQLVSPVNMKWLQDKLKDILGADIEVEIEVVSNHEDIKKKQQMIVENMADQVDEQTGEKLLRDVLTIFNGEKN